MMKRLLVLVFTGLGSLTLLAAEQVNNPSQSDLSRYKDNGCVECHSRLTEPLSVSNRFLEWHLSKHGEKGVSCDKCHGGDAATSDKQKAHAGVTKSTRTESKLFPAKQPETCQSCHEPVVKSFLQSDHFNKLKTAGLGPSCNTCHIHMATKVIYSPSETAELCSQCHNAINFLPPRPEIPVQAAEVMSAFQRANGVINWAKLLLAEGARMGLSLKSEQEELKLAETALTEAKTGWHAFELANTRKKADEAFIAASKVKEALRKKIIR